MKSLAPLIVFFALIILLTMIMINVKSPEKEEMSGDEKLVPSMKLSPFSTSHDKKDSASDVTAANANFKPDVDLFISEAKLALKKGNTALAEDKVRTILIFEPVHFEALTILGSVLYQTKRYNEAEVIFRKQLKLQPEAASVYNNLGSVLAKQNKLEEAIETTHKSLEFAPESPEAYLNLSGMYSVSGDPDSSIKYFKKAYDKIGENIIPISFDPSLDNIRERDDFKAIIEEAKRKAENKSGSPEHE